MPKMTEKGCRDMEQDSRRKSEPKIRGKENTQDADNLQNRHITKIANQQLEGNTPTYLVEDAHFVAENYFCDAHAHAVSSLD